MILSITILDFENSVVVYIHFWPKLKYGYLPRGKFELMHLYPH